MSLDYYLLCKSKYDAIILNLNEVIEKYDDLYFFTSTLYMNPEVYAVDNNEINWNKFKDQIRSELIHVNNCRNVCQQNIHELCNHEFVNDMIDITPERSQYITYCIKCEYTMK